MKKYKYRGGANIMAVLQMQRVSICALRKDRKLLLEQLQRLGMIEIADILPEDSVFTKTDVTVAESSLERSVSKAKNALEILDKYCEKEGSLFTILQGRKEVATEVYDEFYKKHDEIRKIAIRIIELSKVIIESKAEIIRINSQMDTIIPWNSLDVSLAYRGTKYTAACIGTLPNQWEEEDIYLQLAECGPIALDIISTFKEQTCIFVLCLKENEEKTLNILRENGFARPASSDKMPPAQQQIELTQKLKELEIIIQEAEEEIMSLDKYREELQFFIDFDSMRNEKYEVISHLLQSKNVLILTGYITINEVEKLEKVLNEKFDIVIELEEISTKEDAPIALSNNSFSSPLEGTVEAYSLPGKGEIDPTTMMSLFYYLLFGLMLSDAAYGAIIAIVCGVILIKYKNIDDSVKQTMKMYFLCGLFTVFWGIMFGSYFGDVVDVVSETFFGKKVTIPPLWFFPVNEPMRMLVFSMAFGLVHLFAGLAMKAYQLVKQKLYIDILYDVIAWYGILIGSTLLLLTSEIFVNILGLNFKLSSSVGTFAGILAITSAIVIVATNGRESKNPFKRFLKGLYALYGMSGYLSDVLSYSRLLALGLATGVIASVVNKMGGMAGGGIVGAIVFSLVFVFGHALNLAINALGAYVHTNRLQYVEFFGKFYEGGGRKFRPFHIRTKYYKFKENNK